MSNGISSVADLVRALAVSWRSGRCGGEIDPKAPIDERRLRVQTELAERLLEIFYGYRDRGVVAVFRAPTGFGKTEVLFASYLYQWVEGEWFAGRMFLVEPVHALLSQMARRIGIYLRGLRAFGFREKSLPGVGEDHGEVSEPTFLYTAPITLTTVDSFIYGYIAKRVKTWEERGVATGRYSLPVGVIMNSVSVFDEAHLVQDEVFLGPRVLARIMCYIARSGGFVVLSSATISSGFLDLLKNLCGSESIEFIDAPGGVYRRSLDLEVRLDRPIDPGEIECGGRSLVIVNTVDRARKVYSDLRRRCGSNTYIIHSLMSRGDRARIVDFLESLECGARDRDSFILVGTQSVEVGIDYSFDNLYTELSPIDSLIQRIGRVGRFGGSSRVVIYDSDRHPYNNELLMSPTREIVESGRFSHIDLGDVNSLSSFIDRVYTPETIRDMSEEGDHLYLRFVEYLDDLNLFSRPPEDGVFIRPSFYVGVSIVDQKDVVNIDRLGRDALRADVFRSNLIKFSVSLLGGAGGFSGKRLAGLLLSALLYGCRIYRVSGGYDGFVLLDGREFSRESINRLLRDRNADPETIIYSVLDRVYDHGFIVVACSDRSTLYDDGGVRVEGLEAHSVIERLRSAKPRSRRRGG